MSKKKKKRKVNWLKRNTRIVGMNPLTFEEWWRIKINNLQIISISIILLALFLFLSYLFFVFTPLQKILPENIGLDNREEIETAALRVDQLEKKLIMQDHYISNLQNIILGKNPIDSIYSEANLKEELDDFILKPDTLISYAAKTLDESLKRNIEHNKNQQKKLMNDLFLYDPIKGHVSQKFKMPNHPGVDIVSTKDSKVKACLDGTVIHASYNNQDGYNIIISHEGNIISTYKHIKTAFVKTGDFVSAGKSIGIIGNTGERTTGPHLHFELWNELGPIDPLEYFSFED